MNKIQLKLNYMFILQYITNHLIAIRHSVVIIYHHSLVIIKSIFFGHSFAHNFSLFGLSGNLVGFYSLNDLKSPEGG